MSLALITTVGLSAALAGAVGAPLRRLARARLGEGDVMTRTPQSPDFKGLPPAAFESLLDQGAFGEALTAIMMAADGWRPVNGKPGAGPQGIDGVFWRETADGWQVRLVETKTNVSPYKPRSMSDKKGLGDIDALYVTAGDETLRTLYAAISTALRTGASQVRKQLWRHNLHLGSTRISVLDRRGEAAGKDKVENSARFVEALTFGLEELDRDGAILKR